VEWRSLELIWLRKGVTGACEDDNESSGFIQFREIIHYEPVASLKALCSLPLVTLVTSKFTVNPDLAHSVPH
jgi:hypothetical protein